MSCKNIISILLSSYLNIELAFIPAIKYSLATFYSSCQINTICKQQVRSESVFPALLNICKYDARGERNIFFSKCTEVTGSEICRITCISWIRSSSVSFALSFVRAFAIWAWFVSLDTDACWHTYSCLQLIKQMSSLCYRVIDANPLIMACWEVPQNGCQTLA